MTLDQGVKTSSILTDIRNESLKTEELEVKSHGSILIHLVQYSSQRVLKSTQSVPKKSVKCRKNDGRPLLRVNKVFLRVKYLRHMYLSNYTMYLQIFTQFYFINLILLI